MLALGMETTALSAEKERRKQKKIIGTTKRNKMPPEKTAASG